MPTPDPCANTLVSSYVWFNLFWELQILYLGRLLSLSCQYSVFFPHFNDILRGERQQIMFLMDMHDIHIIQQFGNQILDSP